MADIELVIKIPEELYYLVHCPVCGVKMEGEKNDE